LGSKPHITAAILKYVIDNRICQTILCRIVLEIILLGIQEGDLKKQNERNEKKDFRKPHEKKFA
jgi:hypothetical protein